MAEQLTRILNSVIIGGSRSDEWKLNGAWYEPRYSSFWKHKTFDLIRVRLPRAATSVAALRDEITFRFLMRYQLFFYREVEEGRKSFRRITEISNTLNSASAAAGQWRSQKVRLARWEFGKRITGVAESLPTRNHRKWILRTATRGTHCTFHWNGNVCANYWKWNSPRRRQLSVKLNCETFSFENDKVQ